MELQQLNNKPMLRASLGGGGGRERDDSKSPDFLQAHRPSSDIPAAIHAGNMLIKQVSFGLGIELRIELGIGDWGLNRGLGIDPTITTHQ